MNDDRRHEVIGRALLLLLDVRERKILAVGHRGRVVELEAFGDDVEHGFVELIMNGVVAGGLVLSRNENRVALGDRDGEVVDRELLYVVLLGRTWDRKLRRNCS